MKINEYQQLASRSANNHLAFDEAICNWAMGLCGEAGEFTELIKKHVFHGKALDIEAAKKELGDVAWYLASACTALNLSLQEVMEANIEKLKKRYPEKFELGGGIRNE